MKNILRYTIAILIVFTVIGCSIEEINPSVSKDTCIEFVPRPISFMSYNVSAPETRAALTETELSELERKIATPLYFIVYDGYGNRRVFETLEITDAIPSPSKVLYDLYENSGFFPLTVCYLANVSYEYANSLTTKTLFDTKPLEFEYAPQDETGYVGIPRMNITTDGATEQVYENCFPICGYITQNEDGTFPGISNGIVTIPLKRLFAKVKFNLGVNMSLLGESPDSYFNLTNIRITNLPEQVLLKEAKVSTEITESPWGAKNSTGYNFSDPININLTYDSPIIYDQDNTTEGNLKSYSFSFYAPEYALLPDEDKTATGEANKPNLVDESVERPLYLTISGFLKHELTNSLADYKLYLGEDNDESFSIFRNNEYINNMNVTGINHLGSQGDVDDRVDVKPLNLVDIFQEAANCYIITHPGTYILDTYPGVVKDITNATEKLTGTPVEFYDPQNLITINSTGNVNQIEFTVVSGEDQFKDGNAIIALKDTNGNILWSWHIWVVSGTFLGFGDIEDHEYNTYATMLSRNLGAASASDRGAYYQWGRKDPFFVNVSSTGIATASNYVSGTSGEYDIANDKYIYRTNWNPSDDRWGATKQQNDPCPPGYKVPTNQVWNQNTNALAAWLTDTFLYEGDPTVNYPYSTYINSDSTLKVYEEEELRGPSTANKKVVFVEVSIYHRILKWTQSGALWSSSRRLAMEYINYEKSAEILDGSKYRIIGLGSWQNLDANNSIWQEDWVQNLIGSLADGVDLEPDVYTRESSNYTASMGLQVRCVREDSVTQ